MKPETHNLVAKNIFSLLESAIHDSVSITQKLQSYDLSKEEMQEIMEIVEAASCRANLYAMGARPHQFEGGEPSCPIYQESLRFFKKWHEEKALEASRPLEALVHDFEQGSEEQRQSAVSEMLDLQDEKLMPYFLRGLNDADELVRVYSIQAIELLEEHISPEILEQLYQKVSSETSSEALVYFICVFEEVEDERAFFHILDLANHHDPFIRRRVAIALGCMGDKRAIPVLKKLLNDTTISIPEEDYETGDIIAGEGERVCEAAQESLDMLIPWRRVLSFFRRFGSRDAI